MQTTQKEQEIYNKLSINLKEEILHQTYGKSLFQIPVFYNHFSKEFLVKMFYLMKPVHFDPDSIIYRVFNFWIFLIFYS